MLLWAISREMLLWARSREMLLWATSREMLLWARSREMLLWAREILPDKTVQESRGLRHNPQDIEFEFLIHRQMPHVDIGYFAVKFRLGKWTQRKWRMPLKSSLVE